MGSKRPFVLVLLLAVSAFGLLCSVGQGGAEEDGRPAGPGADPLVPRGTKGNDIHAPIEPRSSEQSSIPGRSRITPANSAPWRWIADLEVDVDGGAFDPEFGCTGYFIGPAVVATAAHCLYDADFAEYGGDNWANVVRVIPGRDEHVEPFGSEAATNLNVPTSYITAADYESGSDYGIIVLPDSNLGNSVGWFTYAAEAAQAISGSTANLSGYPGDKGDGSQQWSDDGQISLVLGSPWWTASYSINTSSGQSGAPVWLWDGSVRRVVATHTLGVGSTACGIAKNCGSRVRDVVVANFEALGAPPPNTECATLSVNVSPPAGGSVLVQPPSSGGCDTGGYAPGTKVWLTASAAPGFTSVTWSGTDNDSTNPTSAELNSDRVVSAEFIAGSPHPNPGFLGDPSCDGVISPVDAQIILQFDSRIITHLNCASAADTNQDGRVGVIDATLILQFVVGIIHSLPP